MRRTMRNEFNNKVFYESAFDMKTGVLVREVEMRPAKSDHYTHLFDWIVPWSSVGAPLRKKLDEQWVKRYGYRSEPFSPSPETIDISITDYCNFGCSFCLEPGTPVLRANGTWSAISDLAVGDELLAFEEQGTGQHRQRAKSVVEAKWSVRKPAVRISTTEGPIVCSLQHKWLMAHTHRWLQTKDLKLGHTIQFTVSPWKTLLETREYKQGYLCGLSCGDGSARWSPTGTTQGGRQVWWDVRVNDREPLDRACAYLREFVPHEFEVRSSTSQPNWYLGSHSKKVVADLKPFIHFDPSAVAAPEFMRGWVAGFFDAEGSHQASTGVIRFSQKTTDAFLKFCKKAVNHFGFKAHIETGSEVRVMGGQWERARFFGVFQPSIARKREALFTGGFRSSPATVTGLELLGEVDLVDIQTSTKTFIASGFASHNCYQDSTAQRKHAPNDLVDKVIKSFTTPPYQVAIGGGEPTTHPDLPGILVRAREAGVVPNYTTSGAIIRPEVIEATNHACGGVAMTFHAWKGLEWFQEHYTRLKAVLTCQLNVHLIAEKSVAKNLAALTALQQQVGKLNVVLLAYYPNVGRSTLGDIMPKSVYQTELPQALKVAIDSGMTVAFSEGLLPYFLSRPEIGVETRFASRAEGLFSAYVDPNGRMSKGSFAPPPRPEEASKLPRGEERKWFAQRLAQHKSVWETSLQQQWERQSLGSAASDSAPRGASCYSCRHKDSCATPDIHHYFACAYARHNGATAPLDNAGLRDKAEHDLIAEVMAIEEKLGRPMTDEEKAPWKAKFRELRQLDD